jgi:hypothetical protein
MATATTARKRSSSQIIRRYITPVVDTALLNMLLQVYKNRAVNVFPFTYVD